MKRTEWEIEQLAKSEFFLRKCQEWRLVEIGEQINSLQGEAYDWEDRSALGISEQAWSRVIHRGIKPIRVFAHPQVLQEVPRAVAYYRMLAMVSIKSMTNVSLNTQPYETGDKSPTPQEAKNLAQWLNRII